MMGRELVAVPIFRSCTTLATVCQRRHRGLLSYAPCGGLSTLSDEYRA